MKAFTHEVWEVTEDYDRDSRHVAYYSKEDDAYKHKGENCYLNVYKKNISVIVLDSFEEFKEQAQIEKRNKALAKLNDEDKIILGIKE